MMLITERKQNIVLIDDDAVYTFMTARILEKSKHFDQIITFKNGLEGIDFLKTNLQNTAALPDIILLDLNMPVMDGWEFLDEYKNIVGSIEKDIRIFIVTSSLDNADLDKIKESIEVVQYISKPFNDNHLEIILTDIKPLSNNFVVTHE
jgi:CheY-like chemotaxis protein